LSVVSIEYCGSFQTLLVHFVYSESLTSTSIAFGNTFATKTDRIDFQLFSISLWHGTKKTPTGAGVNTYRLSMKKELPEVSGSS
jgi:hypothetical protein